MHPFHQFFVNEKVFDVTHETPCDCLNSRFTDTVWQNCRFYHVNFTKSQFLRACFHQCSFVDCCFDEVIFDIPEWAQCTFERCTFNRAKFQQPAHEMSAAFSQCTFYRAQMKEFVFGDVECWKCDFTGANLWNATVHTMGINPCCTLPNTDAIVYPNREMQHLIHVTHDWVTAGCQYRRVGNWMNLTVDEFLQLVSEKQREYAWYLAHRQEIYNLAMSLEQYEEDKPHV